MSKLHITQDDLHHHLKARMRQRGISLEDINQTLSEGWESTEAKSGTFGKVKVFTYNDKWEGRFYKQKEVTVFYKITKGMDIILLTAIARYGQNFNRR